MNAKLGLATMVAVAVAAGAVAGEAKPPPDEAIKRLTAELTSKEKQPEREAAAIAADYRVAVGHLVKGLAGDDTSKWQNTDRVLEQLCHYASAPGFEAHRAAVAKALAAHVKDAGLTTLGRARVLRHIERTGRLEVVATLAGLLADKELREPARRALMRNPTPEAGDALRAAIHRADKPFRLALIDALGFRREARFLKPLVAQAADADIEIRLHAVEALARIGSPGALTAVEAMLGKGEGHARDQASDAYLALAERLADAGDRATAVRLFRALLDAKRRHLQCAALIGIGRAGAAKDVDTLVAALGRGTEQRETATRALVLLPDKAATPAIYAKAKAADPAVKARLVGTLGLRNDPAAVPFLLEAAKDNDPGVRVAAYVSLGQLKAAEGVAVLTNAVRTGGDAERAAAETALSRIPGKACADAVAAAIPTAQKASKAALVRALAYHKDPARLPVFVAAAADGDPEVQVAALRALGVLNQPQAVSAILAALDSPHDAVRAAAAFALRRSRSPEATAAIVTRARQAKPAALAVILDVLSWRDHPEAMTLLLANASSAEPAVKAVALQGLARAKDARAVPLIVEAAGGPKGALRDAAVRAALAFPDQVIQADRAKAKAIFSLGIDRKIVPDDNQRRLAVQALGKLGDPDALDTLCDSLRDRRLSGDAHNAIQAIASRLAKAGDKNAAVAVYTTMLLRSNDQGRMRRAQQELKKLGVAGDLGQRAGFVTRWHVCGPFPNPRNQLFNAELPPETGAVDLGQPVKALGVERPWKAATTDPTGTLDLNRAVGAGPDTGALLYAEITVPQATQALLKLGYEEGCVAVINGRKLHSRAGARFRIDDRQVKIPLQAGVNRIVLKITHLTRGWRACCRLTSPSHEATAFTQGAE